MSIEVMKAMANYIDVLGGDSKKYRQAIADFEKQEHGSPEDMYIEMHKHLNCPHCGGSGHIDDVADKQEPVSWESVLGAVARGWCYEENANKTMDSELAVAIAKEVHALYTRPQPKPSNSGELKREPLTVEQIVTIVREASRDSAIRRDGLTSLRIARAIEAAHGIKE